MLKHRYCFSCHIQNKKVFFFKYMPHMCREYEKLFPYKLLFLLTNAIFHMPYWNNKTQLSTLRFFFKFFVLLTTSKMTTRICPVVMTYLVDKLSFSLTLIDYCLKLNKHGFQSIDT